jgi:methionyl-tRNA formyltransferase
MNLVLIADDGPANAWLIRELEQAHTMRCIIRPDWSVPRPAPGAGTDERRGAVRRPVSPFTRFARALRRAYFRPRDRTARERLTFALFGNHPLPEPTTPVVTVPAWDVNGPSTEALLREAAPDLVVVSGAPMLKANIFSLARLGTVNLHFGISPAYRGMHTLLVPWQRHDYDQLGATLHSIDEGVDSGPVHIRVYPALTPADDLVSIEAKIVRQAASALSVFLTTLRTLPPDARLAGQKLGTSGVLVRFHDRTIASDLGDRARRLAGDRVPVRDARVERFCDH